MAIRVLRVIEYVYEDEERMADDMARWTMNLKVKGMTVRSAVMPPESVPWTSK